MQAPIDAYYAKRLEQTAKALVANHFESYLVADAEAAGALVLETILPQTAAKVISFGGSMTLAATGLPAALAQAPGVSIINTLDHSVSPEELYERRRQALLADLFLTGSNAVTEDGVLVNLDMIGNRACAIAFGPKHVVVIAGRNKIVPDVDAARVRIKNFAAPVNALRLSKKTPCTATAHCEDCGSPQRICNVWTIAEKCFPRGRVTVILVNQDLGF
ncbi:lactate utilization protein [Desulfovibrio sp. TomC]|uniref:lactate utilization protein n=1 Tax=Desulfovibrio sp. TomC TaxID=1562888 RepID=UPI000574E31F|nr:lactate utilization protein [Desulfovibrio sp. TomC]KHK02269.1 Transcriptional regulators of sugar metabolism [Desulfovibrio sp. TomC]